MIRKSRTPLSRRTVLRGAGCTVALPWMEAMSAYANTPPASAFPKRFGVVFLGCGINEDHWSASGEGKAMKLSKTLAPMEPLKEKVNVVEGLYVKALTGQGIHPGQTGSILSGAKIAKGAVISSGISVDQMIASKVGEVRNNKKGKARGGFVVPDDRPYPVGYREFPWTPLPARDGIPHGGVKRSSGAPNSSYFVNWRTTEDRITWDVEVATAGTYEVVIDYTCPVPDAGSQIELSFRGAKLSGKVAPGWDPPLNTNQDTLPRPDGESQMKEFRPLNLGTVRLEKGRGELTLRALQVPGKSVMDVRRVNLTLKN